MILSKKRFIFCSMLLSIICLILTVGNVLSQSEIVETKDETSFNVGKYSDYFDKKNKKKFVPHNFLTITQINREGSPLNIYETQGYIVSVYECSPCPEPMLCKPCMRRHVVISQEQTEFDFSDVMDNQIMVFVDEEEFEKGKKYRFVVRVLDVKTTDQPLNNVDLIYAKRIK